MEGLKTLEELNFDGLHKQFIYRRVVALEEAKLINPRRGAANSILLDPYDIEVLDKLIRIEENCKRTKTAVEKLKYQLALEENKALKDELTAKEKEMNEKLQQRDRQIQNLNALVVKKSFWTKLWNKVINIFRKNGGDRTEQAI